MTDDLINCGEIKVQNLYRIVIPRTIRDKYNINPGDSVEVFIKITGEGEACQKYKTIANSW